MSTTTGDVRYAAVGQRIRRLRVKAGLTQKTLAVDVGVSEASLSLYERNLQLPPIDTLGRIADRLGVAVRYFF